ncbi:hypothetical protein GOODEAATRI_010259 [Goodea atripinnis]|uniref:Uncharacterized protein n=1 Tax=Goodea atripinnis TaxID=208336 RepID=A0ABV0N064_9TELE
MGRDLLSDRCRLVQQEELGDINGPVFRTRIGTGSTDSGQCGLQSQGLVWVRMGGSWVCPGATFTEDVSILGSSIQDIKSHFTDVTLSLPNIRSGAPWISSHSEQHQYAFKLSSIWCTIFSLCE